MRRREQPEKAKVLRTHQEKTLNSLGSITYEDAEEEQECIELMNKRKEKTPEEPDVSQEPCVISVRHVSRGLIRCLFDRESLMIDVYNWVGSLSSKPKYFEIRKLPNYVVSKRETVEHCKDVLHMYEIDAPVESLEDRFNRKKEVMSLILETRKLTVFLKHSKHLTT